MTHGLSTTPSQESRPKPHTKQAVTHLLQAKVEIARSLWQFPKKSPTHYRNHSRLQQVGGAITLLIAAVEPMISEEPPEPANEQSEVAR
jgi:hypothetical protein